MARRGENIYKRKDGRYEGRYIKNYDVSGKAIYGYVYSRNYTDLKNKLYNCKINKEYQNKGSSIKLCEWLEGWIENKSELKITSKRIYESIIKNHIIPKIGHYSLKNINESIIKDFIDSLNLSTSTVRSIFSVIKAALNDAEEKGLINNVWKKIKIPSKEKNFVKVLSQKEQKKLEKNLIEKNDIGVLICLYMGLRIGEVCALKWEDIDFEKEIMTVKGTQVRTENGIEVIFPKSKSSKREIPIPKFLKEKLNNMKKEGEYILSKNLKPYDVRSYRRRFKKILKISNLPDFKYHSLRHTFATRALEVGMDFKTLSEILGHSSVGITLDIYAHSLMEHKTMEMDKINNLFEN